MGQRQDLLAGAKQCIAEKGYSRTTARDITAASGANLAAIGYHFGSKEALLNAAILESFLSGFLTTSAQHRAMIVASVQAFAEAEFVPEVREQLAETYEEARRSVAAMLLGIEPDSVDETGRHLGSLVLAIINGTALQWLLDPAATYSAGDVTAALRSLAGPR